MWLSVVPIDWRIFGANSFCGRRAICDCDRLIAQLLVCERGGNRERGEEEEEKGRLSISESHCDLMVMFLLLLEDTDSRREDGTWLDTRHRPGWNYELMVVGGNSGVEEADASGCRAGTDAKGP